MSSSCIWRACPGSRLPKRALVNTDTCSARAGIACAFFSGTRRAGVDGSMHVAATKSIISSQDHEEYVEDALVHVSAEEIDSLCLWGGQIRNLPSVYIQGEIQDGGITDCPTVTLTPSALIKLIYIQSTTLRLIAYSDCHDSPDWPSASVWRRCPSRRLLHRMMFQRVGVYGDPIGEGFFESVKHYETASATIRMTGGEMSYRNVYVDGAEASLRVSAEADGDLIETPVEAELHCAPITPFARIIASRPASPLNTLVRVGSSFGDKMVSGEFGFEKTETGGPGSDIYFKDFVYAMPDAAGVLYPVFMGFFPSSKSTFAPAGREESMTAFNDEWYLTMQYLDDKHLSILSPEDQVNIKTYRLEIDHIASLPKLGSTVTGGTSGHTGRVIEVANHYPYYVLLRNCAGDDGPPYFQDDERLYVNSVFFAYADGHTMDVSGTDIMHPDEWLTDILGGDLWQSVTGIQPYRINTLAWGNSKPATPFMFEETTTKRQAIDEIAKYLGCIFFVRLVGTATYAVSRAYMIPEEDIDDPSVGLDLPDPVTFSYPTDSVVASPASVDIDGRTRYNKITVRCQGFDGEWYESVRTTTAYDLGEKPVEFLEINKDIASQDECDDRCDDIYDYNTVQILKWNATFLRRPDLQKLQRVIFSGFDDIPDGEYRIIDIEYSHSDGGLTNETNCVLVDVNQFSAFLRLDRVFTDSISEIETIANSILGSQAAMELGVLESSGSGKVTVTTERGIAKVGRTI